MATICGGGNFNYVESLGAKFYFDRGNLGLDEVMVVLRKGDKVFDCIGSEESQRFCGEVVFALGGGVLAIVKPPQGEFPAGVDARFGM